MAFYTAITPDSFNGFWSCLIQVFFAYFFRLSDLGYANYFFQQNNSLKNLKRVDSRI